ncbi:hypothetical protein GIB67_015748, partial [Kingdonia uniflora]
KIVVATFTNVLQLDCIAIEYLFLNKPTKLEEMITKVNGYVNLERMMSERQKSIKSVLSTKAPPRDRASESKEEQGYQKRTKGNTAYPQRNGPQNKPVLQKRNVRISIIFPLLLNNPLYRVSQPLEPIENQQFFLNHKVNHHTTDNCYALQRLLELIFMKGGMLKYIVDLKSY